MKAGVGDLEARYLDAYRDDTDQRVREDPRAAVGGHWEVVGQIQFDALRQAGLARHHRLLDIGCGTLRGGRHFIRFLEPGNYTGFDISNEALAAARRLVADEALQEQRPRLLLSSAMDLRLREFTRETFDYILAQSVFTHLPPRIIEEFFAHVGGIMHPGTRCLFTFKEAASYRTIGRKGFAYPFEFFQQLAARFGFQLRRLPYDHPRGQQLVEMVPALITVQAEPFNAESPLRVMASAPTATSLFFVRSNFGIPMLAAESWSLRLRGAVDREIAFTLADLEAMPAVQRTVLLECAGNGRRRMVPTPPGVPWDLGAAGTAIFAGVPLAHLLRAAGIQSDAVEVMFRGADHGEVSPGRSIHFERSLPADVALDESVLIAYQMNGEPLTPEHGYPARLVVPHWYAVASVKWLTDVVVLTHSFDGHFQTEKYRYYGGAGVPEATPVRNVRVRALVIEPPDGAVVTSPMEISGVAWSGSGHIRAVHISTDNGATWSAAELSPQEPHAPVAWRFAGALPRGDYTVHARAEDEAGNIQPLEPPFNTLGYGNNAVQRVRITVP